MDNVRCSSCKEPIDPSLASQCGCFDNKPCVCCGMTIISPILFEDELAYRVPQEEGSE